MKMGLGMYYVVKFKKSLIFDFDFSFIIAYEGSSLREASFWSDKDVSIWIKKSKKKDALGDY